MNLNTHGIYALKCPVSFEIKYIGKSKNISKRYAAHCSSNPKSGYPVSLWIDKLRKSGLKPLIDVLSVTENLDEEEIRLISHYRKQGFTLLNLQDGGSMPASMGNGVTKDVFSVSGLATPWNILCKAMMSLRLRSERVDESMRILKDEYSNCITEKDRLEFQLKCFSIVQDLCSQKHQIKVEDWIVKAAPAINKKYSGRITLAFNDQMYTP
jgi:hypothetical protein